MRRNISRHTHGTPHRTVEQKVGNLGRKYRRLFVRTVKRRAEIHGLLVDVEKHLFSNPFQFRFRIAVSSGRIPVKRSKVSLASHQGITHGKILREPYEGIINGDIAVWM